MTINSQFGSFLEKLKTDDYLRRKLIALEESAASKTLKLKEEIDRVSDANMTSIMQIAKEAGYDISVDVRRPERMQAVPTDREIENLRCWLTCCWIETSVWDTEGPSIGGF